MLSLIRRHRVAAAATLGVGSALLVFVLVYFQPQKLFIDTRVNEPLPTAALEASAEPTPVTLYRGEFTGLAHKGSGKAEILELTSGQRILSLTDFNVENGPDLFVYISSTPAQQNESAYPSEFVNLGRLKGNVGDQNYEISSEVSLSDYRSILIYCKRFSTPFAAASMEEQPS